MNVSLVVKENFISFDRLKEANLKFAEGEDGEDVQEIAGEATLDRCISHQA
jgi:hypothetical protein